MHSYFAEASAQRNGFFEAATLRKKGKKSVARIKTLRTFAAPIERVVGTTNEKKSSLHIGLRKTRNAKNLVNYLESL